MVVGVTGAPGAGKSTLVDALVADLRASGQRVAVLAVDPSSPRSGGAVLGDRARMQRHATDPGVFLRSMATRGSLGGLARPALATVSVLDAAGWPIVLVETVGAGQVEVDVSELASTVVVVVTPAAGDSLQAVKAGLLEIGDVFVVNQADRPGADQAEADLVELAALPGPDGWRSPVVRTVATTGQGVKALWEAVEAHEAHLAGGRMAARRERQAAAQLRRLAVDGAARRTLQHCRGERFEEMVRDVAERRLDPEAAAAQLAGDQP